jgi:A/G-specific adenine glycosylase
VSPAERRLVEALHTWGDAVRRDLPWRRTRDPWAVLVSEAMLQQTQVARVVERFDALLARFPDPSAMASSPLADVLDAWAGLGYYRRARDLHRTACAIVERHDGRVPDDLAELLALPGVGPYTARAVLAFAFERGHGVVDTNAARVLARAFAGAPMGAAAVQRLADALVPHGSAWAHNQSILDLGATVCTARAPRCTACPLVSGCAWRAAGGGQATGEDDRVGAVPDPARTTAGTSRPQATFAGSDRQGRGRILAALRTRGRVAAPDLDGVTTWGDDERSRRVADALVADGLAVWDGDLLRPPR